MKIVHDEMHLGSCRSLLPGEEAHPENFGEARAIAIGTDLLSSQVIRTTPVRTPAATAEASGQRADPPAKHGAHSATIELIRGSPPKTHQSAVVLPTGHRSKFEEALVPHLTTLLTTYAHMQSQLMLTYPEKTEDIGRNWIMCVAFSIACIFEFA